MGTELQLMIILRLLVAALLGGLIGIEREYRSKEAGLRTHFLVCFGSALFMIVSQYGFTESVVALSKLCGPGVEIRADVSRVAAQIVSGIGFLGAGTIVLNKRFVVGLTTAAGLWTTAAIGMSAGAGLYVIAIFSTLLALAGFEMLRHLSHRIGRLQKSVRVVFYVNDEETAKFVVEGLLSSGRIVAAFSSTRVDGRICLKLTLEGTEVATGVGSLMDYLQRQPGTEVESIE